MAEAVVKDTAEPTTFVPSGTTIAVKSPRERVTSVDLVRGFVMILMALDHTRDYTSNLRFQPENLSKATPFLFFTRWITHFCAPSFFLLAGVGAGLSMARGKSKRQLSHFLFTRGLWLIFLELTITHVGWQFSMDFFPQFLLVIWALGLSMMILSALIYLPHKVILALSLVVIAAHNLLDGVAPESFGSFAPLWHILHVPGVVLAKPLIFVGYPLVPWFAVMALGFVLGDVFTWDAERRRRFLVRNGSVAIGAFVLLRFINIYGDPRHWEAQRTVALTIASFGNATKYPPSLIYLLMTLGPALIALALFENSRGRFARVVTVYGKVPMFYYIVHIFVIHALAYGLAMWQGGNASFINLDTGSFPKWYGISLPGVYLVWLIVVALMYLPCRWYSGLKSRRTDWWLGYI